MSSAILLIAHGSRVESANEELRQLAKMLAARRPGDIVEYAYLELAEPSIPQGLATCLQRGSDAIVMLPWFLSSGAHVTQDLEAFRQEFLAQNPSVPCRISPPLGLHPLMLDILLDRLQEAR